MPPVSSDPHAWLRPLYAKLRSHPAFAQLAPSHQFEALLKAAEEVSPSKVALMGQWNSTTQTALLHWLSDAFREQPAPKEEVELWRVAKEARQLRCVAVYLPIGIDVRLMEGEEFRRTQLVRDAPEAITLSRRWRSALLARSWTEG